MSAFFNSSEKLGLVIKGVFDEGIKLLNKCPQIYPLVSRVLSRQFLTLYRILKDRRMLLLGFYMTDLRAPLEEYGDRLLRKKLREGELRKRLVASGLLDGEAISVLSMLDDLTVRDIVTSEGEIDEEAIAEALRRRLGILSEVHRMNALWEIIKAVREELPTVGKIVAEKFIETFENLIKKSNESWEVLLKSIEDSIIEHDALLREEFIVG